MSDNVLLTSLWLLPLIGLVIVLVLPQRSESAVRWIALVFTSATFLATLIMLQAYLADVHAPLTERATHNRLVSSGVAGDPATIDESQGMNDLVVRRPWIPYFNIQYYLGVDGISLSLVVLTGLVSVLACLASWKIDKQVKGYFALFLLLLASMMGVFISLDLFLFYVFFEVMLLPMYFLIGIWGGPNREYAAIKFLLFTLFGSVFILVAILILYFWQSTVDAGSFKAHSFDLVLLTQIASETSYYGRGIQSWIFILFLTGFMVKLPSFPFHTWLPDCARRGADADQHDSGGRPAQNRRLRHDSAGVAACSRRRVRLVVFRRRARGFQHSVRCACGNGPNRLQEAGCI